MMHIRSFSVNASLLAYTRHKILSGSSWTEGDSIMGMSAGERAGLVIVSIAIGRRASGLEDLGVFAGRTRLRAPMVARAAVFRTPKRLASAFTGNHPHVSARNPKLGRAVVPKIVDAAGRPAVPGAARRADAQGDIKAVHEADVVEIRVADCELGEGDRRNPTGAIALEAASAVTRGTGTSARRIELAARPAPEAAGPARRGGNLCRPLGAEGEATASEGSAVVPREDARPDRLRAPVHYREYRSVNPNAPCNNTTQTKPSVRNPNEHEHEHGKSSKDFLTE